MRTLSHIKCFVVGCSNQAAVQVNSDYMCIQCAKHEIPSDYVPTHDEVLAAEQEAKQMNFNMSTYGTIDVPTWATDFCKTSITSTSAIATLAIEYVKNAVVIRMPTVHPTTPSRGLARMVIVLHPYGASVKTILSAIHDMGWTEVTEADVEAVVAYIKEII